VDLPDVGEDPEGDGSVTYIYLAANLDERKIWVMEHEGDYNIGDTVVRVSVSDHESIVVDVKPNCQ
jgi:hypothetical protein